jgi:phage major head subunit gpT-like protein
MDIRTQYSDLYLTKALPALRRLTNKEFQAYPEQYPKFFNVLSSTQSIEQDTGVGQFGLMVQRQESESTIYDSLVQSFSKTYIHLTFTLGYELAHELIADDKFGLAMANAQALGRTGKITPEVLMAGVFLNAYTSTPAAPYSNGPDGQPLFSASHLKERGGTQSNIANPGVDLNIPAIEAGLTVMRQTTDDAGKLMVVVPDRIVVGPSLEFRVAEFLGGTQRSDTADHTLNAFRMRSGMSSFKNWDVWDYFTFNRAWFLLASKSQTGLKAYWREKFNQISKLEFENRSAKTAAWMRLSFGYSYWQGTYGSPGAGSSAGS